MYGEATGYDLTLPTGIDPTLGAPSGSCLPSAPYEVISCNLDAEPQAVLPDAETDTSNAAFLRDEYGDLASSAGHSGGPIYDWVYYSDHADAPLTATIVRIPFTRASVG